MTDIQIGDVYTFLPPLKFGEGVVVDIIEKGTTRTKEIIDMYYMPQANEVLPQSVYRPIKADRIVLKRKDVNSYVIIPESTTQIHLRRKV